MNTKEQFLLLLRIGLWGGEANPENFPTESTDWKGLYKLAEQQTVVGIVYDGLSTLPLELQPDQHLLRKWYIHVLRIENSHNVLNKTLVEIFSLYEEAGFTPILLKGQGIAQCYRNPSHRNCGDIDVFVGEKDYKQVNTYCAKKNIITNGEESNKHFEFYYKGISIENHRIVARMFNQFSNKHLANAVNEWFPNKVRHIDICDKEISLPPVSFDSVFILIHATNHFIAGGVGLRQLCDWSRLLHTYSKEIDRGVLGKKIKELGLERIWALFGYISVNYLGLPVDEMPFYSDVSAKKAEKALVCIFKEGNFGHLTKSAEPKMFLIKKLFRARYTIGRLSKVITIFPRETFIFFIVYLYLGIKSVTIDKL
jgi:hypothetical protein